MSEEKKPKNPDAPCKGCESRCAVCHIKCPGYAEYKARLARRAQERDRANAENPAYMKRPYRERYLKKMMERQKRGRNT